MKKVLPFMFICLAACMENKPAEHKPAYDETSLKTFVFATHATTETNAIEQLDSVLQLVSGDSAMFRQTISFLETPFSNPTSPYRNQNLYTKVLQAKLQYPWYNGDEKKIAVDRIRLMQQNNVGNPANDFAYKTPAGYSRRLYDIKANHLLLYFNNPECNACREMKTTLMNSSVIGDKLKIGDLKILSVYTDQDEQLWLNHLSEYPADWIQGRDDNEYLSENKIYDLRAIPSIYLLDKDKNVLLKDCMDITQIEAKLKK
jgi:hypothetical protein